VKGKLALLFEDEHLFAVNKPSGLASVPSPGVRGTTCQGLARAIDREARAVHRLDRETSGVMVFARSERVLEAFRTLFREQRVRKRYLALVRGGLTPAEGTLRMAIARRGRHAVAVRAERGAKETPRGQDAQTRYRVIARLGERARAVDLVEAWPQTGRYNQIRVHFAATGHPLIGERKYARGKDAPLAFPRVALHAASIQFPHPILRKDVSVEAPLPEDLQALLKELGGEAEI
jgi:RluA family pseudouridine synthase